MFDLHTYTFEKIWGFPYASVISNSKTEELNFTYILNFNISLHMKNIFVTKNKDRQEI